MASINQPLVLAFSLPTLRLQSRMGPRLTLMESYLKSECVKSTRWIDVIVPTVPVERVLLCDEAMLW